MASVTYSLAQAADYLNVSPAYLTTLLEAGRIGYAVAGGHRRVGEAELSSFKQRDDAERARVLEELTFEAERCGLGY